MKPVRSIFCILSLSFFCLIVADANATVDREEGRRVSTQCALCHGPNGEGNGMPKSCLSCIDTKTFLKNIHDFQNGVRRNYIMEQYAKKLSDQDIRNLVAYYESKKESLEND